MEWIRSREGADHSMWRDGAHAAWIHRLAERFNETALGCPGEDRLLKNLEVFLEEQRGLKNGP